FGLSGVGLGAGDLTLRNAISPPTLNFDDPGAKTERASDPVSIEPWSSRAVAPTVRGRRLHASAAPDGPRPRRPRPRRRRPRAVVHAGVDGERATRRPADDRQPAAVPRPP